MSLQGHPWRDTREEALAASWRAGRTDRRYGPAVLRWAPVAAVVTGFAMLGLMSVAVMLGRLTLG